MPACRFACSPRTWVPAIAAPASLCSPPETTSSSGELPTLSVHGTLPSLKARDWRATSPSEAARKDPNLPAMLPTLKAVDGGGHYSGGTWGILPALRQEEEALLPTLTATRYGSNQGGAAGRNGSARPSLEALLPTLAARDWKTGCASEETWDRPQARPLVETLHKTAQDSPSTPGSATLLCPRFAEQFMGFPTGWTESLDPPDGPPPEDLRPKRASKTS